MRLGFVGAVAFVSVALLTCGIAPTFAQMPPPPPVPPVDVPMAAPGFVPRFEIMRTLRAAGFDPLAPPLREGTAYVVRATDFRGILMRVVLDARTGAIRDATRIMPPDAGPYGMNPPPYGGPPPYATPYGPAADDEPPTAAVPEDGYGRLGGPRGASRMPGAALSPPLPRPRPAAIAARKRDAEVKPDAAPAAMPAPPPADTAAAKPEQEAPAPHAAAVDAKASSGDGAGAAEPDRATPDIVTPDVAKPDPAKSDDAAKPDGPNPGGKRDASAASAAPSASASQAASPAPAADAPARPRKPLPPSPPIND